ncbi:MAG TPA: acetolactate synthase [Candidatus Dormibacteraeota bacterium]|nr:acetolactate synthase [Candidatus Dormibacteraeota bacterium]
MPYNVGRLMAAQLQRLGVGQVFTLSGGHIFPLYDGCVELGIRLIDTRHEEHAVHAAEAWAKLTRQPGVAAVTAGPGVTNSATGLASAKQNGSPALVIGGRAPDIRWGQGSLQEMDHLPIVRPLTKHAATVHDGARAHIAVAEAWEATSVGEPGPSFLDVPMDVFYSPLDEAGLEWPRAAEWRPEPDPELVRRAADLIAASTQPVVLAGTGVYWHHGEDALRELAESAALPVYANGMGRGCLASDNPNALSRTRGAALGGADLVILLGTPLDFRLNFGSSIPEGARVVRIDYGDLERNRVPDVGIAGHVGAALEALAGRSPGPGGRAAWLEQLRGREAASRERERAELESDADPIHPMRIYGELLKVLDRDAVVIGDGGDFVSYAGKVMPSYLPGHWLDPGPFGTLGMGPGGAIAARLAHPDKQVVLLLGDGAFGFAGMEFDTMVRHRLPVVAIVGNNAAWGLEKHPMEAMYGWSVAADLNPGARYDRVVEALGGHGELVTKPGEIGPAIRRAFASGLPALVNVMCDPQIAYPRQTIVT